MESYLVDVNKLRIPRPKFATGSTSGGSKSCRAPRAEPPRDYNMDDDYSSSAAGSGGERTMKLQSDTEDIRQAIQEKL